MIIPDLAQFTYQLGDLNYNRALAILNEIQGNIEEALNSYLHNADHHLAASIPVHLGCIQLP